MKKNALVLSGGGFKGAYQVGAIEALRERGLSFDYIAGVSVGALNGAMLAMNDEAAMRRLWDEVGRTGPGSIYTSELIHIGEGGQLRPNLKAILRKLLPQGVVGAVWQALSPRGRQKLGQAVQERLNGLTALTDNAPLLALLEKTVRVERFTVPYEFGCVDLETGNYHCFTPADFPSNVDLARAIGASASMPGVFPPTAFATHSHWYAQMTDGGVRNVTPLGDAIDFINRQPVGDDWRIIVVNCNSGYVTPTRKPLGLPAIAARCLFDITLSEVFHNDIEQFLRTNWLVRQAGRPIYNNEGVALRYFDRLLIGPKADELGDTLDSSPERLADRQRLGYAQALVALEHWEKQPA